jgi:hypothetical protein
MHMSSGLLVRVCYSNKYNLAMGNKTMSYNQSFKLQVVQYAEKHGKWLAGSKFYMNEQCIGQWCKQKEARECTEK